MAFEDLDFEDDLEGLDDDEDLLPEEASNRTFMVIAGVLGGVALLAIICIAFYALFWYPNQSQNAEINATNTAQALEVARIVGDKSTAVALTSTAASWTATPTETPIPTDTPTITATFTPGATDTPVLVVGTTAVGTKDPTQAAIDLQQTADARATLEATQTLTVLGTVTSIPTAAEIPGTGFADDVGLPMMLGLAALLIVIIFLARRLRASTQ